MSMQPSSILVNGATSPNHKSTPMPPQRSSKNKEKLTTMNDPQAIINKYMQQSISNPIDEHQTTTPHPLQKKNNSKAVSEYSTDYSSSSDSSSYHTSSQPTHTVHTNLENLDNNSHRHPFIDDGDVPESESDSESDSFSKFNWKQIFSQHK